MKTYKLQIEISVSENWIADGFNPETKAWKERIEEAMTDLLPYAIYETEISAKVTKVITPKFTIKELEEIGLIK